MRFTARSTVISVGLLVKRREDAKKMAARAKELIEETVPQKMKPFIELAMRQRSVGRFVMSGIDAERKKLKKTGFKRH